MRWKDSAFLQQNKYYVVKKSEFLEFCMDNRWKNKRKKKKGDELCGRSVCSGAGSCAVFRVVCICGEDGIFDDRGRRGRSDESEAGMELRRYAYFSSRG